MRDYVVTGSPYAGADRHNGEIAAFHLNRYFIFKIIHMLIITIIVC